MDPTDEPTGTRPDETWNTGLRTRQGMSLGERIRAEDAYGILLVLIIVSLVVAAIVGDTDAGSGLVVVVEGGVLLFALYTSRSGRGALRTALVLVPIVALLATAMITGDTSDLGAGVVATTSAVLCLTASAAIVRRLGAHPRVDAVTILGALSTYLLIGSFFASVFLAIDAFSDQPFFATTAESSTVDFYYFSYVTLTTTGYGDLTARTDLGRMLAVTEALLGQLYLVSVVALVIGNVGRERRRS